MRAALAVVGVLGCGRLGFDPAGPLADGAASSSADAPPLPATLVCSASRVPAPPLVANADVTIHRASGGFTILSAAPGGDVYATTIDASFTPTTPVQIAAGPVDSLAGLFVTSSATLFVTQTGALQTLWASTDLKTATVRRAETSIASHLPIVTDDSAIPRAWLRAVTGGVDTVYLTPDGVPMTDNLLVTTNPVVAVAGADNTDHAHIVWTEVRAGGVSHCQQADLDLSSPLVPQLGPSGSVSDDCYDVRMDSGPPSADAIFSAYRTFARTIGLHYEGSLANLSTQLAAAGRAPRVRFDGTSFWVAWIDETAGDTLMIANVAEDLTYTSVALPGWTPVGDNAFDLVRTASNEVYLFVASADTFNLLRTCQ